MKDETLLLERRIKDLRILRQRLCDEEKSQCETLALQENAFQIAIHRWRKSHNELIRAEKGFAFIRARQKELCDRDGRAERIEAALHSWSAWWQYFCLRHRLAAKNWIDPHTLSECLSTLGKVERDRLIPTWTRFAGDLIESVRSNPWFVSRLSSSEEQCRVQELAEAEEVQCRDSLGLLHLAVSRNLSRKKAAADEARANLAIARTDWLRQQAVHEMRIGQLEEQQEAYRQELDECQQRLMRLALRSVHQKMKPTEIPASLASGCRSQPDLSGSQTDLVRQSV